MASREVSVGSRFTRLFCSLVERIFYVSHVSRIVLVDSLVITPWEFMSYGNIYGCMHTLQKHDSSKEGLLEGMLPARNAMAPDNKKAMERQS